MGQIQIEVGTPGEGQELAAMFIARADRYQGAEIKRRLYNYALECLWMARAKSIGHARRAMYREEMDRIEAILATLPQD